METILVKLEEAHEILLEQSSQWKSDPNAISRATDLLGEALDELYKPKTERSTASEVYECELVE